MNKKFLKKILSATVLVCGINFLPANFSAENFQIVSIAHAEMQNYTASDVAMLDFGENDPKIVSKVQNVAKLRAIQAAKDKAGVYLKSYSRTLNGTLTDDEIFTVTNNISEILDVNFEKFYFQAEDVQGKRSDKKGYLYKATVTVKIDNTELLNYMNRDAQEKANLVRQNKNLRLSLLEIDSDFEDLRKNSDNKTPEQIQADLNKIDNEISAAEKISEGNKFAYQKDYRSAISSYNEAMEINPNSTAAKKNVDLLNETPNKYSANDAKYFYNRGVAYFDSANLYHEYYRDALQNFEIVIKLSSDFPKAHEYIKICKEKIAEYGIDMNPPRKKKSTSPGIAKAFENYNPKKKNTLLEDIFDIAVEIAKIRKNK